MPYSDRHGQLLPSDEIIHADDRTCFYQKQGYNAEDNIIGAGQSSGDETYQRQSGSYERVHEMASSVVAVKQKFKSAGEPRIISKT